MSGPAVLKYAHWTARPGERRRWPPARQAGAAPLWPHGLHACAALCARCFSGTFCPFPACPARADRTGRLRAAKKTAPSPAGGRPHGGTGRQVSGGGAYCAWPCRGGNCTVMAVPTPTWLSSESCAPMPAAMCLTMARPRPVPPVSFERLLSTR